ncbi:MAG TPA: glutamine--fructose-6-phosphate aminotransferase, partial [Gimesia maris]|nr:glutamine--fructose-6-phosphate aminotransferase [Gimesia maris]
MCGIVGYIGHRQAGPILIKGLQKLEYRGYDSAGVAVHDGDAIQIRKKKGRVIEMASLYKSNPVSGTAGIGHTRWATHGETNDQNSHPHVGGNADVVIVHNGVIENYTSLRKQLQGLGYVFRTTTDT